MAPLNLIPNLLLQNLDAFTLLIIGWSVERRFLSRMGVFSNSMALNIFYARLGWSSWYLDFYLGLGLFLGIIGLLAYISKERLDGTYYDLAFLLYNSIVAGALMLIFH